MGFMYNTEAGKMVEAWFLSTTIKIMLLEAGYTPDRDHDVVDAGGADDPIDHEYSGAGYVGGFGGSGRKTLSSKTVTVDKANDRAEADAADVVYSSIGSSGGPTVERAVAIVEAGADDTGTRLVSQAAFAVTPNGGDVTVQINDFLRVNTV